MRLLFLEPFYGGSHRDFAKGLCAHSRHAVDLVTLPPRFWKWRMRGAALHFVQAVTNLTSYDGIMTTGLMSLADLTALCKGCRPPTLLYCHESQLTYPLAPGEEMDLQFGFTDITSALCADRILFNSHFHCDQFFRELPHFIARMPEFKPRWAIDAIRQKAGVLHPGCRFPSAPMDPEPLPDGPPLVIWNHRWEFDKNPDAFFDALERVHAWGIDFRLAIMGEASQVKPAAFERARSHLKEKVVHYGYLESRKAYTDWLKKGLVAVSTAIQENFGIAMVEAMRYGCLPLMPHRLSYPEILPREFHQRFLYRSDADLAQKLAELLSQPQRFVGHRPVLAEMMARHAWETVIDRYDNALDRLVRGVRTADRRPMTEF